MPWLADNDGTGWTVGATCVQFYKNSSHHIGINCKPFSSLIGSIVKLGLTNIPSWRSSQQNKNLWGFTESHVCNRSSANRSRTDCWNLTWCFWYHFSTRKYSTSKKDSTWSTATVSWERKKIVISDARIGDDVTIPIAAVDRGRADPLNTIGVIADISDNNNNTLLFQKPVCCLRYTSL